MRVAMISTPFVAVPPRDYGGTELVVHELVEGLVAREHEVTLFATGDSSSSAELRWSYAEAQWPPSILPELNHVSWALQEVAAGDYDVVHLHSAPALACARLLPGTPVVYTVHHERTEDLAQFYGNFPEANFVAISADQARRMNPRPPRLTTIHHGVEAGWYEWTERPSDYVAFVGRFAQVKGPHVAIDAAARAGVPIRVAGETHSVDGEFGKREVEPRLSLPHVTYLGKIGMAQKVPLLRDARALLAPIAWNEPFGLVLAEAMLSGCPVVGFPRGSIPELVEEGVTGFIAQSPEQLTGIIRPGGPLEGFDRGRCRARAVERFSRERMVDRYERLYERVVREAGRGPTLVGAA